ncbi:TonB-dependent receptor [Brevundimonas variabilis]|uniref:Catecholate siderophore receptor n=1 Tax=Brevundimonas variabilis TaxID=74312 RepID=A0A7W9CJY1_9CAUL|nr:TonB-dependent receptor [Brevundimonas variabilis]MBB5746854.1 catecholate siderophore receptor [Brevundimonas variabilis]
MSDSRPASIRALLFASTAAGMLCASPALAAPESPEPAPEAASIPATSIVSDDAQDGPWLGTIDVDGRRTARQPVSPEFVAPLVDTPRAVTIIPRQIIEQTGATSLQDILRTSPGITFGAGEGGQPLADRPFIRGQSSGNNIFVDGIRDSGGQQREVFNLEQVEVIKGPDAVYSGRGSGGGSINLSSKSPRPERFTGISAGVGTDGYWRGTIDQNWNLGQTAAVRFNLLGTEADVAGRGPVSYDTWGAALSLAAGLGTDTTAVASYYHLDSQQLPDYGIPLYTKLAGATGPRANASGILDVDYDSFYGLEGRDFLNNTVDTFTFEIKHRINDSLSIRNVSRYSETLNDYLVTNPGDGGTAQLIGGEYWMKRGTKSRWNPAITLANVTDLTGTVSTGPVRHSFNLGAEFTRETNRNASYSVFGTTTSACPAGFVIAAATLATVGGGDCTRVYDPNPGDPWAGVINRSPTSTTFTETAGVYAFDSLSLNDRLIANLGIRWDRYTTRGTNAAATQAAGVWIPGAITVVPEQDWDFVNYQAGLVFKPTPESSLYASWSTASTPPTISAGDQNGAGGLGTGSLSTTVLDPEDTESYEVGAKINLFDNRLALSGAAFHLTRRNAAILVGPSATDFQQVGEVRVQGIELGISGNITPAWQVFGGYTWMDSELVRGAVTIVDGRPVPSAFEGDPLANTPEHSASLFTTYRVTRPLSVGGGIYYVSRSFGGNQGGAGGGANRIFAPEYTRIDLFAAYDLTERASLQLNVQNAGDADYILRTNGVHHADPAPARSATLALNLRF